MLAGAYSIASKLANGTYSASKLAGLRKAVPKACKLACTADSTDQFGGILARPKNHNGHAGAWPMQLHRS